MTTHTTNFGLIMPDQLDGYQIDEHNFNSRRLDELVRLATPIPTVETAGTGVPYTIDSDLLPPSPPNGFRCRVRFHMANPGQAHLRINSENSFYLRSTSTDFVRAGLLAAGSVWEVERSGNSWLVVGSYLPDATESMAGVALRATQAQAQARTDNTRFLSPLRGEQLVQSLHATQAQAEAGAVADRWLSPLRGLQQLRANPATTTERGSIQVQTGNGLGLLNGLLSMALGTNSVAGALRVAGGNGLSVSSGNVAMAAASTSAVGAVQLNNNTNSTSTTQAATADAVRQVSSRINAGGGYISITNGSGVKYAICWGNGTIPANSQGPANIWFNPRYIDTGYFYLVSIDQPMRWWTYRTIGRVSVYTDLVNVERNVGVITAGVIE